jgi:carbon monoxide dehydrogenase subunit G
MAALTGNASIEIAAPIDEVWAVCEDVASSPAWQKGLDDMVVLERDGDGRVLLAESVSDAKVRTIRSRVRFSYDEPRRVAWRQESGELKRLEGAWELEDLGAGRTRATYRLDGDPGRVLGMLLRGPTADRVLQVLVRGRPQELEARLSSGPRG